MSQPNYADLRDSYVEELWLQFRKYLAEETWGSMQSLLTEVDSELGLDERHKMEQAFDGDKWQKYMHWVKKEYDDNELQEALGK